MKGLYSKNLLILLAIVAVIALLIFFNNWGLLSGVKNIFFKISSPFLNFFQSIAKKISDFCQSFPKVKNLKKENEILVSQNRELLAELSKLKEAERENEILREQFKFSEENSQIFAQVRGFGEDRTSILINQGENTGISNNAPALAKENIIIGKIIEVYPDFSKALLISDFQSEVTAMTQEGRAKGVLRGRGAQNYPVLEMISKDEEIKAGDKIIASGLDNIFPKGLLIGEVLETKKSDVEVFQEAKVKPYVDFNDLEEVFVIITPLN